MELVPAGAAGTGSSAGGRSDGSVGAHDLCNPTTTGLWASGASSAEPAAGADAAATPCADDSAADTTAKTRLQTARRDGDDDGAARGVGWVGWAWGAVVGGVHGRASADAAAGDAAALTD